MDEATIEQPQIITPRTADTVPAASARRSRVVPIIAGGALVVAVVVVVAIILLNSPGGSNMNRTYQQKLSATLAPLVIANNALSTSLQALKGNDTQAAENATIRAQQALVAARGAVGILTAPKASLQLSQQAQQAFTQESGYLQSVSATIARPGGNSASGLQGLASNTASAFVPLASVAPGVQASLYGTNALVSWAQNQAAVQQRRASQHAAKQAAKQAAAQHTNTTIIQPTQTTTVPSPSVVGPDTSKLWNVDQNIRANQATTGAFADNVFVAYFHQWQASGVGSYTLSVYSPTTNQTYDETCTTDGTTVNCTHGGDFVNFPLWAVEAY